MLNSPRRGFGLCGNSAWIPAFAGTTVRKRSVLSDYYPMRDQKIADVEQGEPESVGTCEQLGWPVIKAFNAALAHTLAENGQPHGTPKRIAMPVASDDSADKTIVEQLVDAAGFDPVDAGTLAESWRQHPGTPA